MTQDDTDAVLLWITAGLVAAAVIILLKAWFFT